MTLLTGLMTGSGRRCEKHKREGCASCRQLREVSFRSTHFDAFMVMGYRGYEERQRSVKVSRSATGGRMDRNVGTVQDSLPMEDALIAAQHLRCSGRCVRRNGAVRKPSSGRVEDSPPAAPCSAGGTAFRPSEPRVSRESERNLRQQQQNLHAFRPSSPRPVTGDSKCIY